jgi:hypothetical protein
MRYFLSITLAVAAAALAAFLFWYRGSGSGNPSSDHDDPAANWFIDVTDAVGLDFVHDSGPLDDFFTPQIHGSGVALFDYDGDGRCDIYLLTNGGPRSSSINRLYKNMPDGTFKDVTSGSGLGIAGYNMGVAIGDINNDGWPDVLVTQYGGIKLFLNNGNGTFTDITEESGLKNPAWGTSAAFFDFDRDGWLDLVVVNYFDYDPSWVCHATTGEREYCGPNTFRGTVSKLFRNLGDGRGASNEGRGTKDERQKVGEKEEKGKGPREESTFRPRPSSLVPRPSPLVPRFQDVTVAAGLAARPGPGLGVYCADFDGDGWPDIFIANDGKPNHLWINQKNGTFSEEAFLHGLALDAMGAAQAGMGVAAGDVDNNGLIDLYVTHLTTERNTLWLQAPKRGLFHDRTAQSGLFASEWRGTGFGTLMADFDQDGWLDIPVVNGRILPASPDPFPGPELHKHLRSYCERNQLFRNDGQGKFRDVSRFNSPFCGQAHVSRGLAAGDLDGDGALDLIVTNVAGRARLFRNVARPRGHWLAVRAVDPRLKRDAYGAEIVVQAGEQRWLRIISPAESYLCSSVPQAHFGLGAATRFDAVKVRWPDGKGEVFAGGSADQCLVLRRGEGKEDNGAAAAVRVSSAAGPGPAVSWCIGKNTVAD